MLRFESQYLREILIDNSDRAIMEYCNICYYEMKKGWAKKSQVGQQSSVMQNSQAWFLLRTMSELSLIFKDKAQSPMLKFKSTKLITYLLLMNEPQIYKKFQLQLFPLIKNICYYNKSVRIQERGYDFFKKNKYFDVANVEERQKIKIVGAKFVIFCLEVVYMMSKWLPLQVQNRKELTAYGQAYENLIKEGVRFPEEQDFMFFSESKVAQMLKNVQKCQSLVKDNKFSIHSTKLVKYNAVNRSNLSNEGSVSNYSELPSNLQKQLQEKEEIINEYRQNMQEIKQEKQFLIKQFDSEKQVFKQKLSQYQTQLRKLYYEVKYLRKKLKKYQKDDSENQQYENKTFQITEMLLFQSSIESQRSDIVDLKQKIRLLIQENMRLKQQNADSQKKICQNQDQIFLQSRRKMNDLCRNKKQLIQELLKNDCQENRQFQFIHSASKNKDKAKGHRDPKKNQIFQEANFLPLQQYTTLKKFKSEQILQKLALDNEAKGLKTLNYDSNLTIFEPFFSFLNTEIKNRLKRCLLKSKQILYKDANLQIGIKTIQIDQITLKQQIIITNIINSKKMSNNLKNIKFQIINKNQQGQILLFSQKQTKLKERNKDNIKGYKKQERHTSFSIKNLTKDEQYKFEIKIEINNVNFSKGLFVRVSYEKENSKAKQMLLTQVQNEKKHEATNVGLILPISKIKLVQILPKASKTLQIQKQQKGFKKMQQAQNTLMKLFYLNQKVLESLGKLVKYFGEEFVYLQNGHNQKIGYQVKSKCEIKRDEDGIEIDIRVKFLDKFFTLKFGYVQQTNFQASSQYNNMEERQYSNQKMSSRNSGNQVIRKLVKMIINYEKTTSYVLAEYLASEFVFVLSEH